jgi:hypothetical protein
VGDVVLRFDVPADVLKISLGCKRTGTGSSSGTAPLTWTLLYGDTLADEVPDGEAAVLPGPGEGVSG